TSVPPLTMNSWKPYAETSVKSAEPTQTRRCVRSPACRSRSSRLAPTAPPSTAASESRSRTCGQVRDGTTARLSAWLREGNRHRPGLKLADPGDACGRKGEQIVERLPRERISLRRRLHLDQPAVAGHDDVHVRVRA